MGCERKDTAPAGSDLVRQISVVNADEILHACLFMLSIYKYREKKLEKYV